MFPLLVIAAAQVDQPSAILVGGWDNRPTLTVAEGYGKDLAQVKTAAEKCGFSRSWVWDDDSDEAQLWVLAVEASGEKTGCLNQWRNKHRSIQLKWKLHQAR
jgi:hypothetical protein